MAMPAFYMGALKRRHGEPRLDRIDKNGTEHWVDLNCPKCGGTGYLPGYEFIDGARCWKCDASGYHPYTWKVMTPEYAAKLNTKRDEKARQKNLAERPDFLLRNGFNSAGITFVVVGKTFEMKDELKAMGAKYCFSLGWHLSEKPEALTTVEMTIEDCFWENTVATLHWRDTDEIQKLLEERAPRQPSTSEYLGEIGKRLTVTVRLEKSFSFENNYGYYPTTSYIHNFKDALGNVIIWKTTSPLCEGACYELTGTVKEHSEYKGTKQTVLTRCKTQRNEQA